MTVTPGRDQILEKPIDIGRGVAEEGESGAGPTSRGRLPVGERLDTGLAVEHDPQTTRSRRLGMHVVTLELETHQPIEISGAGHVGDDDTDCVETWHAGSLWPDQAAGDQMATSPAETRTGSPPSTFCTQIPASSRLFPPA